MDSIWKGSFVEKLTGKEDFDFVANKLNNLMYNLLVNNKVPTLVSPELVAKQIGSLLDS